MRPNSTWQNSAGQGFDTSHFQVDWENRKITCPNGKVSQNWRELRNHWGNQAVQARFSRTDCRLCVRRSECTRSKAEPRSIRLRTKAEHQALQTAREQQNTSEWKEKYKARAGVEGTLSQGVGAFGLRYCCYRGLAKTHLQHVEMAAATNVVRIAAWLEGQPHVRLPIPHVSLG